MPTSYIFLWRRKNMSKRITTLLVLMLALVLAACTTPAETTTQPTAEVVEPTAETMEPTAEAMEPTEEAMEPTEEAMEPTAEAGGEMAAIESVCLVTDLGNVNDGTFNEFAYDGMVQAVEEFGLESTYIETQSETDYERNINTCVEEGFDAIITVGFLIGDATLAAAEANPDVMFIGVDQFFEGHPENIVGIQFREDQGGFLVGALACMMTESGIVGGVYGVEIPPVIKFRNGYENGCAYVNPDASTLGVYLPSFIDPAAGASAAEQFLGEGADVIFGAGGPTGSGGIRAAAEAGVWVLGVDQDEYVTTFGGGSTPGADRLLSSALKRVDVGVYDQIKGLVEGSDLWQGGSLYILDAANGGITYADFHDAADSIPEPVKTRLEEIRVMLADGDLNTGVSPVDGALIEGEIPEPVPFEQ
jgi:basic membrane protein A